MTRVGECKQCGACCTHVGWVQENVVGFDEWAMARKLDFEYSEDKTKVRVFVRNVCPHFVAYAEENPRCDLHGKRDKPDICQDYPVSPEQLMPGCGFSFCEEVA